jgi:hypothetical protein
MATRKVESAASATTRAASRLDLAAGTTRIRSNGIEFRSATPIAPWTEMTVVLHGPQAEEISATGVVVDCRGDRHQGYTVSMVFMELTPHAQARLSLLAYSNLA